jgi:drug/metabolite transporter (DMT)-like permease
MKANVINTNRVFWIGTLLTLPTAYFIFISILKYGFGISGLFNSSQPLLENLGIKESPGLNINLLILFGPAIALLLNLFAVLKIDWQNENEFLSIKISIKKHWWNMVLVIFSGILLATLFIYALGENCRC